MNKPLEEKMDPKKKIKVLIQPNASKITKGAHYGPREGFGRPNKRNEIC